MPAAPIDAPSDIPSDVSSDASGAALPYARLLPGLFAVLAMAGCAHQATSPAKFDVDAFLRGSDTALPELLASPDFLRATRASANECAVMLQSTGTGVLEDLPAASTGGGPAWLLHPAGKPDQVWLVVGDAKGERSCHGPLPAQPVEKLVERAKG